MSEVVSPSSSSGSPVTLQSDQITSSSAQLAERLSGWVDAQNWVPDSLNDPVAFGILLTGLLLGAAILYFVFRPIVLRLGARVVEKSEFDWDNELVGHGVLRWLTQLLPGLLIYLVSPGLFESAPAVAGVLRVGSALYLLLIGFFVFDSIVNSLQGILSRTEFGRRVNLATFVQVAKLLASLLILILSVALLLGKSPAVILGGAGVFASVLMLIFKDVILGFVAGIQLASNKMLRPGDWLEMPSHNADGDVEEIGLTTVKVRNFDRTITTVPTYALISSPFKNWRGMSESDGRRIKRCLAVDMNSIRFCDEDLLERLRGVEHLSSYLDQKEKEIEKVNQKLPPERRNNRVNGRRLTNVGTYRAYIEAYLRHHPDINQEMTLLVRQLAPVGQGLPIEIYCFSANKAWAAYEAIQADIFDHLIAVAPEFDLGLFQEPSGKDFNRALSGP